MRFSVFFVFLIIFSHLSFQMISLHFFSLFDLLGLFLSRKQYFYSKSNWIKYCLWSLLPFRFPVSFLAPSLMDPHSAIHQGQVYSILVHVSYLYILTLPLPSSHNCCPSPVLLPSPSPVPACLPLSLPILPSGPCSTCFLPCSSLVALLLFLLTLFAAVQIPHFPQSPNLILLL